MGPFLKITVLVALFVNTGCETRRSVSTIQNKQEMRSTSQNDYSSEGFIKAEMMSSKSSECPFILAIEGTDEKLDPVNIDEEKFSIYKKEGAMIWIKFQRLRRANRCPDANPVQILEIKQ